jgi:hypothetical protein
MATGGLAIQKYDLSEVKLDFCALRLLEELGDLRFEPSFYLREL